MRLIRILATLRTRMPHANGKVRQHNEHQALSNIFESVPRLQYAHLHHAPGILRCPSGSDELPMCRSLSLTVSENGT